MAIEVEQQAKQRRFAPGAARVLRAVVWASFGWLLAGGGAWGDDAAPDSQWHQEVDAVLIQLGSDQYERREKAAERLQALAKGPHRAALAIRLREALVDRATTHEARTRVELLLSEIPGELPAVDSVSDEDIIAEVARLDSDTFAERAAAASRLRWWLRQEALAGPIMTALKHRLANEQVSLGAYKTIEPLWREARGKWLLSDVAVWRLPDVAPEQIQRWIDQLAQSAPAGGMPGWPQRLAEIELTDLLARDDYRPRVERALKQRLAAGGLPEEGAERLQRVLEWTQPAMVAEYWLSGRHLGIQHLLIGVPNRPEAAERASLFDYIDDKRAHCVSGNALSPGDYRVGVMFPHPRHQQAQFHLVNLSTPRLRLAYDYRVDRDEALRLAELTERTLAAYLAEKKPRVQAELLMLRSLDMEVVSRHAEALLTTIDDAPAQGGFQLTGRDTHHGTFCYVLAGAGTRHAAAGVIRAIEAERFLPPQAEAPYRLPEVALLAIARRDPWSAEKNVPSADEWLLAQLERRESIVLGDPQGATLSATAAAVLLDRYGANPGSFGLEVVEDDRLMNMECPGYRWQAVDGPQRVTRWWTERQQNP